jgi:hypothetical protein
VTQEPTPYATVLEQLESNRPRLAAKLAAAEKMRAARTALMMDGVRFHGLDELLGRLDRAAEAWEKDAELRAVAFLVRRATADFETAIEAGISGYPSVASDAMRDVMEIELLFLDFTLDGSKIDRWLHDRSVRRREFKPVQVRERTKLLHEIASASGVSDDYAAHSESLHVAPSRGFPFEEKGHVAADDILTLDFSFIEIFEHARRFGNALVLLAGFLSPESPAKDATGGTLPALTLALERTREIQTRFLKVLRELADSTDDDADS